MAKEKILMITEKSDQVKKLAPVLKIKKSGLIWNGHFEGKELIVIPASGHLLTNLEPQEVAPSIGWNNPKALETLPYSDKKVPIKGDYQKSVLQAIKRHMSDASEIIIATDSDPEGEAIGWELLDYFNYKGPVRRAWFSAGLDIKSLTYAMANLRRGSETYGFAVQAQARNQSDWLYQWLVRVYTHYASYRCLGPNLGHGKENRERVVSVGRVQTATLGMVVKRENQILNFVSRDHFKIHMDVSSNDNQPKGRYIPDVTQDRIDKIPPGVEWEPSKTIPKEGEPEPLDEPYFVGENEVDGFIGRLQASKSNGKVLSYTEGIKKTSPPKPFDSANAASAIARKNNISSDMAQHILEDLYEQGYLSYPRTSKSDIPINLYEPEVLNPTLKSLMSVSSICGLVRRVYDIHNGKDSLYSKFVPKAFVTKDMQHYGIIPTGGEKVDDAVLNSLEPKKKDDNQKRIVHTPAQMKSAFMIVAERYIETLCPPAIYATQEAVVEFPVEDLVGSPLSKFKINGETVKDPGYLGMIGKNAEKDSSFPVLKKGDVFPAYGFDKVANKTQPPKRFTSDGIFVAMSNVGKDSSIRDPRIRKILNQSDGIGTPATKKTTIRTLLDRGYIVLKKNFYYPTDKGFDLVKSVPDFLSNPETTAYWEDYLQQISTQPTKEKSHEMRDKFVTMQKEKLEKLIKSLNNQFANNLGEKIQDNRPPNKKMLDIIGFIAKRKNIEIPSEVKKNFSAAFKFIEEHGEKRDPNKVYPPSEAQVKLINQILSNNNNLDGTEALNNSSVASKFIDDNLKKLPPTEGMVKFANNIIAKMTEDQKSKVPKNVLTSKVACSKFIEKNKGVLNKK